MLRFDPGFGRVRNARQFQVWEGGGEYNVARAMRKCWGKRATRRHRPARRTIWAGWSKTSSCRAASTPRTIIWRDFDGLGRNTRVGLNFTEKGFGIRAALGCSDRGHSRRVADQARRSELGKAVRRGRRALVPHRRHLRGAGAQHLRSGDRGGGDARASTAPSFPTTSTTAPSLWKSQGGKEGAQKINRNIAKYVDVMIGNEEDFTACLGFEVEGLDEHISAIDPANFKKMIQTAVKQFPNFKVAATTLRNAKTASVQRLVRHPLCRRRVLSVDDARESRDL